MKHFIIFLLLFFLCSCRKENNNYIVIKNRLEAALKEDQKYRVPVYDPIKQNPIDAKNLLIVTKIIDSAGWLGEDKIGKDANLALFAIIQHANSLEIMEKYLPIMKDAASKGNADKSQLAYLIDRVELLNNRKQIYGTQYSIDENGKVFFENLADSSKVDLRRKTMNLESLEDYIKEIKFGEQGK
ncbi:DUF6624 domain-containing protein [Chryseobacterium wanjuense]